MDQGNQYFRQWRDHRLRRLNRLFTRFGMSAMTISALKVVFALLYLYFLPDNFNVALLFLLIGSGLDLLDGPLARYQGLAHDRGKFFDILTDQLIFAIFILGLIWQELFNPLLLAYIVFILPVLFLIIIINKNEFMPSDWLIVPIARISYYKNVIFIVLLLAVYGVVSHERTGIALWIINLIMTLHAVSHLLLFYRNHQQRIKKWQQSR